MNAAAQRVRFEQVAKGDDYFFDAYTSAGGGGAGDLSIINMAPADFGADVAVAKHTPITFTVHGGASHVLVALRYENSHERVIVYDDGFQPGYTAASFADVVDDENIDFSVIPNGGWLGSIGCFSVIAVDDSGNAINFGDE